MKSIAELCCVMSHESDLMQFSAIKWVGNEKNNAMQLNKIMLNHLMHLFIGSLSHESDLNVYQQLNYAV